MYDGRDEVSGLAAQPLSGPRYSHMDSGNGHRDEELPPSLPAVVPEKDEARGTRALEPARPSQSATQPSWVAKVSRQNAFIVFKTLGKAVAVSTAVPDKTIRFALGATIGGFLSWIAVAILEPLYPITGPMSYFLMIGLVVSMGGIFTRTSFWAGTFTSAEEKRLDRAQQVYTMKMNALDAREEQLRRNGLTGREIEDKLGPQRDRALATLHSVLAALPVGPEGEKAVVAAIQAGEPKQLPPKSDP